MQIDLAPCFTAEEVPLATRLLAAKAKRHGVEPCDLLRAAVRDLVFDEAGRPDELTTAVVEAAETRAEATQMARDAEAARIAAAEAETTITPITNQEPTE